MRVAREPLLGDTVTVDARGDIVLAKIGAIAATSMSIQALADTVRSGFATFLRNPAITLTALRRISVNGEVGKPNVYYVDISQTLRDVISVAGGITDIGDEGSVMIIRRGNRIAVPHWRDDFTHASDLLSGDEVYVGKRSWVARNAFSITSTGVVLASLLLSVFRR